MYRNPHRTEHRGKVLGLPMLKQAKDQRRMRLYTDALVPMNQEVD